MRKRRCGKTQKYFSQALHYRITRGYVLSTNCFSLLQVCTRGILCIQCVQNKYNKHTPKSQYLCASCVLSFPLRGKDLAKKWRSPRTELNPWLFDTCSFILIQYTLYTRNILYTNLKKGEATGSSYISAWSAIRLLRRRDRILLLCSEKQAPVVREVIS